MSSLNLTISITPVSETEVAFRDTTGTTSSTAYGQNGNIAYSSVTSTRIKFASYTTLYNKQTLTSGTFTQYKEYINTGTTQVIDSKTFVAGDVFVPQVANIAVTGTWQETGYYVYPFGFLPSSYQLPQSVTGTDMGLSSTTINDNIWICQYEVYYPQQTPTVAAVSGSTYIVSGSGTVAYKGNVYRSGEVFIASDTTNITVASGTPKVNVLYADTSQYFVTSWFITQSLYEIVLATFGKPAKINGDLPNSIVLLRTELEAVNNACYTNNVSLTQAYDIIQYLSDQTTIILDQI